MKILELGSKFIVMGENGNQMIVTSSGAHCFLTTNTPFDRLHTAMVWAFCTKNRPRRWTKHSCALNSQEFTRYLSAILQISDLSHGAVIAGMAWADWKFDAGHRHWPDEKFNGVVRVYMYEPDAGKIRDAAYNAAPPKEGAYDAVIYVDEIARNKNPEWWTESAIGKTIGSAPGDWFKAHRE